MKLIDFIKSNDNWRDLLASDPYNVAVKDYEGNESDLIGLTIFVYNQIESDFHNEIVRECRGSILDLSDPKDPKVICRPFDKFGNYGEGYVTPLNWDAVSVQEKIDGSLIKFYYYKGKWRVATNGTVNAYECDAPARDITFGDLVTKVVGELESLTGWFDTQNTYMFELCTPKNRVVVPHKTYTLYALGVRNNSTGQEFPVDKSQYPHYIRFPKMYEITSLDAAVAAAQELPWDNEGYVAVDDSYNRCKIKSPDYLRVHRLAGNGSATIKRIVDLIEANELDEVLIYFPELQRKVDALNKLKDQIGLSLKKFYSEKIQGESFETQKDFALTVKDSPQSALWFQWRKVQQVEGKDPTIEEMLSWIDTKTLRKIAERELAATWDDI
jgi:hypothetical protein